MPFCEKTFRLNDFLEYLFTRTERVRKLRIKWNPDFCIKKEIHYFQIFLAVWRAEHGAYCDLVRQPKLDVFVIS